MTYEIFHVQKCSCSESPSSYNKHGGGKTVHTKYTHQLQNQDEQSNIAN